MHYFLFECFLPFCLLMFNHSFMHSTRCPKRLFTIIKMLFSRVIQKNLKRSMCSKSVVFPPYNRDYNQGQQTINKPGTREYFYFIDHQGMVLF